jgi:hypothetical protein
LGSPTDPNLYYGPALVYLDNGEYMIYDINCSDSDAANYGMKAVVVPDGNNDARLRISYYNGVTEQEVEVGELVYTTDDIGGQDSETSEITFNIFAGKGYLKWYVSFDMYFNLVELKLYYKNPLQMNNCDDVYLYKYNYVSDYKKNCRVDEGDLLQFANRWAVCYSPDPNECP